MIYSKFETNNKMHAFITAEDTDIYAVDGIWLIYKDNDDIKVNCYI